MRYVTTYERQIMVEMICPLSSCQAERLELHVHHVTGSLSGFWATTTDGWHDNTCL